MYLLFIFLKFFRVFRELFSKKFTKQGLGQSPKVALSSGCRKLNGNSKIAKSFGQAFSKACRFLRRRLKSPFAKGEIPMTSRSPEDYLWSRLASREIPFVLFAISMGFFDKRFILHDPSFNKINAPLYH